MQFRDMGVLAAVILIVAMLIIPLPTWLLSFLIIINITLALLVLLTAMNMKEALDFSIFSFRLGSRVANIRLSFASTGGFHAK